MLRSSVLFARLDDETAAELAGSMTDVRLSRGQAVFAAGDRGDSLYLIVSGRVKVVRPTTSGRETVLSVLGAGQIFGELSVIDEGRRDASATAVDDVALLRLDHQEANRWLDERPDWAVALLAILAKRLRRANDVVADLVFADVPTRVARTLVDLTAQFGAPEAGGGVRVAHGLTQTDLAQLVGAARETVNKSLSAFADRGWIRLEQRAVVVLDPAALEARAT